MGSNKVASNLEATLLKKRRYKIRSILPADVGY
jgi:hypothetical protein